MWTRADRLGERLEDVEEVHIEETAVHIEPSPTAVAPLSIHTVDSLSSQKPPTRCDQVQLKMSATGTWTLSKQQNNN